MTDPSTGPTGLPMPPNRSMVMKRMDWVLLKVSGLMKRTKCAYIEPETETNMALRMNPASNLVHQFLSLLTIAAGNMAYVFLCKATSVTNAMAGIRNLLKVRKSASYRC